MYFAIIFSFVSRWFYDLDLRQSNWCFLVGFVFLFLPQMLDGIDGSVFEDVEDDFTDADDAEAEGNTQHTKHGQSEGEWVMLGVSFSEAGFARKEDIDICRSINSVL